MPNTKSAERRARNSTRKHQHNHSVKSNLKTLERSYLGLVSGANPGEAVGSFRSVCSALDKAAKTGVIHRATANRKKSRLAARLQSASKPAAEATPAQPVAAPPA
jgi:small subunit ribosomal protein S20